MNRSSFSPAYLSAAADGRLSLAVEHAAARLKSCDLCPRECRVDRTDDTKRGYCSTGKRAVVASYHPHFGEEAPLVGRNGSGTIFFSHCSLLCNFCQNFDISHQGLGEPVDDDQLAAMMIALQQNGCHNINLVSPSHVVPQILAALEIAAGMGLKIPLVYNSSGYDKRDTLKRLEGIVDIYMPDFKFWQSKTAADLCHAADYPDIAKAALKEMHRQVGDLVLDEKHIAQRGLLVRHLVLPQNLADTYDVMQFIAQTISTDTYVNIMPQYHPCGRAGEIAALGRGLANSEFDKALKAAREAGIKRLDQRRRAFVLF